MARWMRSLRPAAVVCAAVLALLVLPASALALVSTGNGGWQWLDPQPQGNNLETVVALDPQHAVIGGDNGALLTTSDGGQAGAATISASPPRNRSLSFVGTRTAGRSVAAGPQRRSQQEVHRAHERRWQHLDDPEALLEPWCRRFRRCQPRLGMGDDPALREGGVWSTRNGGRTWKFHAIHARSWAFTTIDFVDTSHGWAAGYTIIPDDPNAGSTAAIFATSDGGASWHKQHFATDAGWMNMVSFVNTNDGWAVGNGSDMGGAGTIVATTDGGATWSPQSAGTDWDLSGITFVDAEHGWLPEGDSIYATTDGGTTWAAHDAGIAVTAVSFADDLHGYGVGPGGAMATTTDGGATWQVHGTTTPAGGLPGVVRYLDLHQAGRRGPCLPRRDRRLGRGRHHHPGDQRRRRHLDEPGDRCRSYGRELPRREQRLGRGRGRRLVRPGGGHSPHE